MSSDRPVPAVIGTALLIDDEMATHLSSKFYESLAEGRSLEQAWQGAADYVKVQIGDQGFSASTFMDDEEEEDVPTVGSARQSPPRIQRAYQAY